MIITYCDRIERMSPSQARHLIQSEMLSPNCPLDTPCGTAGAIRQLAKLRGCGEKRAAKIVAYALSNTTRANG